MLSVLSDILYIKLQKEMGGTNKLFHCLFYFLSIYICKPNPCMHLYFIIFLTNNCSVDFLADVLWHFCPYYYISYSHPFLNIMIWGHIRCVNKRLYTCIHNKQICKTYLMLSFLCENVNQCGCYDFFMSSK